MDDRHWMYTSRRSQSDYTTEWMNKTDAFLNRAFGKAAKGHCLVLCPCSKCGNRRRVNKVDMGKHLLKNGFTPDYTRWVHHGEAHRMREEVVRPRVEAYDADAGVADMLDDFHQGQFDEGREKEEMEAAAQAFYDMMDSAQKPLHDVTTVSQLDAIGRLMGLKSELNLSREGFDKMLAVIGTLLPEDHILPKSMYESQKLLRAQHRVDARQTAAQHRVDALEARLEQEMRQRQELEAEQQRMSAQLEAERAERQAQTQRLADITEFLQGLGQHTGFAVPAGLLAPPSPPRPAAAATPPQSAGSNNPPHAPPNDGAFPSPQSQWPPSR